MTSSSAGNNGGNLSFAQRYLEAQKFSDGSKIWMKKYRTEIAASSASFTSTFVAYPLDSVKTRMQAYHYRGVFNCITTTYKAEGIYGFMRGVTAPLVSIALVRTISFSVYQKSKYFFDYCFVQATGHSPLLHANTRGATPSVSTVTCFALAGAVSGCLLTSVSCPFELTKIKAQTEHVGRNGSDNRGKSSESAGSTPSKSPVPSNVAPKPEPAKLVPVLCKAQHVVAETTKSEGKSTTGTWGTLKENYKSRGIKGLYCGARLHLLRDTIGTAVYFGIYESVKQLLANARGNEPNSPLAVVIAGGLCGLTSWACIYPIDNAKTIYQNAVLKGHKTPDYKVPINYFKRASYRGITVSMARSCLINAIFFSVFETMKKGINKLELEDEH